MGNGIGTFKHLPHELTDEEMRAWLDEMGNYELVAHHTETPQENLPAQPKPSAEAIEKWLGEVGEGYGLQAKQASSHETQTKKTIKRRVQLDLFKKVGEVLSE